MQTAITAIIARPDTVKCPVERVRLETLTHCYCGPHIPVALIFFGKREFVVDFTHFDEEKRWMVASRLSEHLPIYKGLSAKRIWRAGIECKLRISINNITFWSKDPIPDHVINEAIA
jgi:hypothetical protein